MGGFHAGGYVKSKFAMRTPIYDHVNHRSFTESCIVGGVVFCDRIITKDEMEEFMGERIDEVTKALSDSIEATTGVNAFPCGEDVHVSGLLSEIWEWAQDWRSEIEELG